MQATTINPCSLATPEEVSEAFGQTIEKAVQAGNTCTYIVTRSNDHGIKVTVSSGDTRLKYRIAAGGVGAGPVDLVTGEPTEYALGSGEQAAYAYGSLYFFQDDTFVTIYMGGAYGGLDAQQKAAAIARKMLPRM